MIFIFLVQVFEVNLGLKKGEKGKVKMEHRVILRLLKYVPGEDDKMFLNCYKKMKNISKNNIKSPLEWNNFFLRRLFGIYVCEN